MSLHDRSVATTPLQGTYYETDNKRVFLVLSNATIGTMAEAEISDMTRATRNGRATWKALPSRFGREMYVIAQAKKAYEPQKNNQFDASKDLKHLGLNWSMYLSNFLEQCRTLESVESTPLLEVRKCQMFATNYKWRYETKVQHRKDFNAFRSYWEAAVLEAEQAHVACCDSRDQCQGRKAERE
jgi:hypothetical protein